MFSLVGSILRAWQKLASRSLTATGWSLTSVPSATGGADDLAPLDAAAGQGDVEDAGEVVAAGVGVDLGGPAELAHPDDQGPVEHPRGLQVGDQRGEPGVDRRRRACRRARAFCWWVSQPLERTSTNVTPACDQPAGEQAALAERGLAVGGAERRRLLARGRTPSSGARGPCRPSACRATWCSLTRSAPPGLLEARALPARAAGRAGARTGRSATGGTTLAGGLSGFWTTNGSYADAEHARADRRRRRC